MGGRTLRRLSITRDEFEAHPRTRQLMASVLTLAKRPMLDEVGAGAAGASRKGLEHLSNILVIILIGGTVKIPLLLRELARAFPATALLFPAQDPQLMVVAGSAMMDALISYTDADPGARAAAHGRRCAAHVARLRCGRAE